MVMIHDKPPLSGGPGRVAVIGGGAAGVLAALHLLEAPGGPAVAVVEPARELGSGIAYRTRHPLHLLNVPAGRLSAYPDRPDDFVSWLDGAGSGAAGGFVPRRLFGEYLRDRLVAATQSVEAPFEHVRGKAVGVEVDGSGVTVALADGRTIGADRAVLAIGQPQERRPEVRSEGDALYAAPTFVADPWATGALDGIRRGESALLVGTGLTMIDIALELGERGVDLIAVSRRGLLPRPHLALPAAPASADLSSGGRLRDLVRAVRAAAANGEHWSATVDGLRPLTQDLWRGLTVSEQERFLRHLAPQWNVHRHRMPPQTAAALERLRGDRRLTVLAGDIRSASAESTGLLVELQPRGGTTTSRLRVDHIVNCAGPRSQLVGDPPRLVRALVDAGVARLDAHGLGLETDADGSVVDRAGASSQRLFVIGALRRGTLLESTAVPELRAQARSFAGLATSAVSGVR
jgi:uncharacterized NAD(P)/FAD-binding protein YdhS